jgi:serine/threonine protein kinase
MGFLYHGIEGKKIFHFDIKPANILYKRNQYIIADFGASYVKKKLKKKYIFKINYK